MHLTTALLSLCALGTLAAQPVEMISLPVMDPPKSEARRGENVFNLLPRAFQKNPQFEMTIQCAPTAYGHTVAPATPDRPVYYVMHDDGRRALGETMDRERPPENLNKMLVRSLSTNGYLPAEGTPHAPSLVLIFHWGSSYETDVDSQIQNPYQHMQQRIERLALTGAEVTRYSGHQGVSATFRNSFPTDVAMESLATQVLHSLYFAAVSAYDHDSVARGKPELVWRANLTANAHGVSMGEALPALVLTAGTSFGRDTKGPQFVTRQGLRGKVTLGPLLIVQNDVSDKR